MINLDIYQRIFDYIGFGSAKNYGPLFVQAALLPLQFELKEMA